MPEVDQFSDAVDISDNNAQIGGSARDYLPASRG
jgi:hypothetical protein